MDRDLSADTRRSRIQVLVQAGEFVRVPDLAERFGASAVTIRSGLCFLADRGYVVRARGGVIPNSLLCSLFSTAACPYPAALSPAPPAPGHRPSHGAPFQAGGEYTGPGRIPRRGLDIQLRLRGREMKEMP